jgi:DNA-directed RNA polymerase alpha subunit
MKVTEKEYQESMKLVEKYNRLITKHEGIIRRYYRNLVDTDSSIPVPPNFDKISIWELDNINVYTLNILKEKTNIRTLGDLCRTNPYELFKVRGLGKYRFGELIQLVEKDYKFKWYESHGFGRGY